MAGLYDETTKSEDYIRVTSPTNAYRDLTQEGTIPHTETMKPATIVVRESDGSLVKVDVTALNTNKDHLHRPVELTLTDSERLDARRASGGTTGKGPATRYKGITTIGEACNVEVNPETFFSAATTEYGQGYVVTKSLSEAGKADAYSPAAWRTLITGGGAANPVEGEAGSMVIGYISGKAQTAGFVAIKMSMGR